MGYRLNILPLFVFVKHKRNFIDLLNVPNSMKNNHVFEIEFLFVRFIRVLCFRKHQRRSICIILYVNSELKFEDCKKFIR